MNAVRRIEAYQFFNMLPKSLSGKKPYNIYYNRYDMLYRYDSECEILNSKAQAVSKSTSSRPSKGGSTFPKSISSKSVSKSS